LERLRTLDPFDPALQVEERELSEGLQQSITHLLAVGRRGFSDGNHAAAERAFRSVLAVDANNESARGYLSYIETIRRASQTAGGEPAAFEPPEAFASDAEIRAEGFHQNALAAEASGDRFAAINHDLQALNAYAGHAGARRHLTQTRQRLTPQVEILIEEGRTHFRNEDLQSALDSWQRALLVDPGNERAQAYAERAVRQLGNLERLRSEPDVASGER
jgi:tetratricopeptide (TPR) repeat protein